MKALRIGGMCLLLIISGSILFAGNFSIHYGVNQVNLIRGNSTNDNVQYLGSGLNLMGVFGRQYGFYTNLMLSFLPPFAVKNSGTSVEPNKYFLPLTTEITLGFGGEGSFSDDLGIMFGVGFHTMILDLAAAESNHELNAFGWTWGLGGSVLLFYNVSSNMSVNLGVNGSYDLVGWASGYNSYDEYSIDFARSLNWTIVAGIGFHF